jgi:hypothetical protein
MSGSQSAADALPLPPNENVLLKSKRSRLRRMALRQLARLRPQSIARRTQNNGCAAPAEIADSAATQSPFNERWDQGTVQITLQPCRKNLLRIESASATGSCPNLTDAACASSRTNVPRGSTGRDFGGAAMRPESADYLISTEAVTNITVLAWDRTTIRSLRARYERLADNVALIAYDYLVLYRSLHLAARCDTAPQRFALVLANLATGIGRQVDGGFELDVRNEELANEAGVTIFTASRLMSKWALEGTIAKGRGKVVVLSLAALSSLAGTL